MQVDSCKLSFLCAQSWWEEPTSTLVVYFLIVYFSGCLLSVIDIEIYKRHIKIFFITLKGNSCWRFYLDCLFAIKWLVYSKLSLQYSILIHTSAKYYVILWPGIFSCTIMLKEQLTQQLKICEWKSIYIILCYSISSCSLNNDLNFSLF